MKLRSHRLFRLFPAARRFPKTSLLLVSLTLVSTCYYFLWFNGFYARNGLDDEEASVEEPEYGHQEGPTSDTKILLVTALFPLPNVKHTQDEYEQWLSNFIGRVQTDTYFWTTPHISEIASRLSTESNNNNNNAHLILNETFTDPFDVPPLSRWQHQYTEMHEWDRERARHTDKLYAIWNAKPYLLNAAIENLRKENRQYDYAFWVDAGSFRRPHVYSLWPDPARVDSVWDDAWRLSKKDQDTFMEPTNNAWLGEPENRAGLKGKGELIFFPTYEVPGYEKDIVDWRKEKGPVDVDFSEGTFFGSTPDTIAWYTKTFYRFHDQYITTTPPTTFNGKPYPPFHFVGKDQTLINAIIFRYPHRFFTVISPAHQGLLPPNTLPPAPSEVSITSQPPHPLPSTLSITPSLRYILTRSFTTLSSKIKNKLRGKPNGPFGDEWFYFQFWLAGSKERNEMCQMWDAQAPESGGALWVIGSLVKWWEGWVLRLSGPDAMSVGVEGKDLSGREMTDDERKGEQIRKLDSGRCRVTRGFPVVRLLEALYGKRWVERVRAEGE